jgi:hypothetical protein
MMPWYGAPHTKALLSGLDPSLNKEKALALDAGGAADAAVDYRERPPADTSNPKKDV